MKEFFYTIRDGIGLHARPAGALCKLAKTLDSKITVIRGEKSADATRVIALMGMGIKNGDTVRVTVEGGNEENAAAAVETFFEENL